MIAAEFLLQTNFLTPEEWAQALLATLTATPNSPAEYIAQESPELVDQLLDFWFYEASTLPTNLLEARAPTPLSEQQATLLGILKEGLGIADERLQGISDQLAEFFAKPALSEGVAKTTTEPNPSQEAAAAKTEERASEPEVTNLTAEQRQDFSQCLTKNNKLAMVDRLNEMQRDFLSASLNENMSDLSWLMDNLTIIMIQASQLKLTLTADMCRAMIAIIEWLLSNISSKSEPMIKAVFARLVRGLDILWEIRTFIEEGGDEVSYWQNKESKDNYINVKRRLDIELLEEEYREDSDG